MANPLTGDFEAVLQISGGTLNRLMASMHQNDGANPSVPSFPHSVGFRLGDSGGKFKGRVWAQVSVPLIELLPGSEDRFRLNVSLRARFVPDPGTPPLPGLIDGTVRADYLIEGIDPSCRGWGARAADYIWVKVIEDSVSFTGTAFDDASAFQLVKFVDDAVVNAQITKLVVTLLKTEFQATPHKVSGRFQRGSMRSLNDGAQSALAVPVGLTRNPPVGRLDSIRAILIDGRDFAVGVSREYILSRIQPPLDDLRASFVRDIQFHSRTYADLGWFGDVDVVTIDIGWRVTLTKADAQWIGIVGGFAGGPFTPMAMIVVSIAGHALTQKSVFNIEFDVTQLVSLTFDSGTETISVAAVGSPTVNVHAHGVLGPTIEQYVKPRVQSALAGQVQGLLDGLGSGLDLGPQKAELERQLRTIDGQSDAHFVEATFNPDGIVLKGAISLTRRRKPVGVVTQLPERDGFTAFLSWLPGGRIDAFEWSWAWSYNEGSPGAKTLTDRFLLRRPSSRGGTGKYGFVLPSTVPLPGLDGSGQVCVNVKGVQVDPVTGHLVNVETGRQCVHFNQRARLLAPAGVRNVFLREWAPSSRDPNGRIVELGLVQVDAGTTSGGSNTLVVYVDGRWSEETESTLRNGLAECTRDDAGLLVLVLFPDGMLDAAGESLASRIGELAANLQAPTLVNEDVGGGWADALSLPTGSDGPAWRLLSPDGGVTWMHDGRVEPRVLAAALDDRLFASPVPNLEEVASGLELGTVISQGALESPFGGASANDCPPSPFARLGVAVRSVVTFVQIGSTASEARLSRLGGQYGRDNPDSQDDTLVAVVVAGATDREAAELVGRFGSTFRAISDPDGTIAGRFGVRVWPTTVTLNQVGMVTGFEMSGEFYPGTLVDQGPPPDADSPDDHPSTEVY